MTDVPSWWAIPPEPIKITKHYSAIHLSDELKALYGLSIPQRFITGMSHEEIDLHDKPKKFTNGIGRTFQIGDNGFFPTLKVSPHPDTHLVVSGSIVPSAALELLKRNFKFPTAQDWTQDGRLSIKAGTGSIAGIVYKPTTEAEAARNLNFAIANLTAYVEWDETGREEARVREENAEARRAELAAQAKREADVKAAEERLKATRLRNGLDLFNAVSHTRYMNWPSYVLHSVREDWAKQAELVNQLKRDTNPYATRIFNGGIISADAINTLSDYINY